MDYLGVPVMAQWYRWHQIPFDNDYPHYFPAKPGFEEDEPSAQALAARLRAVGCTAWVTTPVRQIERTLFGSWCFHCVRQKLDTFLKG